MDFIKIFLFYSKINHRTTSYKTAILEVPSGIMHYLEIVPKFFSFLFELTPHFMLPGWTLCFLEIQLWKVKNCHFRVKIIIKYFTIFSNFSVFNKVLNRGNFVLTKRSKIVLITIINYLYYIITICDCTL